MRVQLSLSSKQLGDLYHYTSGMTALKILRTGKLILTTGQSDRDEQPHMGGKLNFASFTRSRFGSYHYTAGKNLHGKEFETGSVIFTVDGDMLSQRYKIRPVDFFLGGGYIPRADGKSEAEERLVSDKHEVDILSAIKRVDFIQPRRLSDKRNKSPFTYKITGSILLQLKKRNIPYKFYDSAKDWAHKKNGFNRFVKKVFVQGGTAPTRLRNPQIYADLKAFLEALTVERYEDMSGPAQEACNMAAENPNKVLRPYKTSIKVAGSSQPANDLAQRVARVLRKKNFNRLEDAAEYIANKVLLAEERA